MPPALARRPTPLVEPCPGGGRRKAELLLFERSRSSTIGASPDRAGADGPGPSTTTFTPGRRRPVSPEAGQVRYDDDGGAVPSAARRSSRGREVPEVSDKPEAGEMASASSGVRRRQLEDMRSPYQMCASSHCCCRDIVGPSGIPCAWCQSDTCSSDPEEEHVRSVETDVVPPVRHRAVDRGNRRRTAPCGRHVTIGPFADTFGGAEGEANTRAHEVDGYPLAARRR